uniref:Retinoic acid induced 14 n=1 Tax=Oncorhynchus mykiss TaxID=8022 RepID=A0A8C7S0I8_ONCMY
MVSGEKAKYRLSAHEWSKNDERLMVAVEHGEVEKVASLLTKKGASVFKLDSEGKSALHVAATRGQTECLAVMLAHGADTSVIDASGYHIFQINHHSDKEIIWSYRCRPKPVFSHQSKCVLDTLDCSGKTALHHAGKTCPLLLSARHAHADVCSSLLDWGADVNACDKNGRTAVMLASESSSMSVVEVLVQRGAVLQAVDSLGHDVLHYAKLSGSSEIRAVLTAELHSAHSDSGEIGTVFSTDRHDQVARLGGDRSTTPKKRKAPPPPISPVQVKACLCLFVIMLVGQSVCLSVGLPVCFWSEGELHGVSQREEVEKLHEEKCMLLETIENLKQIVDQTAEDCGKADSALVVALHAKITALSLENQQLAQILKKRPSPQGGEVSQEDSSRPNSMNSNASYHITHKSPSESLLQPQGTEEEDMSEGSAVELSSSSVRQEEEESGERGKEGGEEEIRLLRETLGRVHSKLQETQKENCTLHARLKLEQGEVMGREGEVLLESLAELQQALQRLRSSLEQEVKELRSQLAQSEQQRESDVGRIREQEARLKAADDSGDREKSLLVDRYQEAQEEIRMLQEALRGTVPVEAAAKDFEEMKGELGSVIDGLQRRLLELSKSYSEAKSELSSTRNHLEEIRAVKSKPGSPVASPDKEQAMLRSRVEELQASLADTQSKYSASLEEIALLKQEAEAQESVALSDHTQMVSSLGSAIKDLEAQADALRQQLSQRTLQVDTLQNRLTMEKDHTPEDSISRLEHEQMREGLEKEEGNLTQLLQGALRKQDEMALEAAAAWQELREGRSEREALQELAISREKENHTLSTKLREAQDAIVQLKKLVEEHVSSERDKNKKIDDLSREVGKLKDALNSLSQLSYSAGSAKRQQTLQQQQLDNLQQQVKQLQYQLGESKRQHHEIVSVYRMHLLYAVQGQMDEDVQKALKQILMMCKMPTEAKLSV